ncbi:MAG TPA: AsmA family protein [Usitatibacter sp.]|nr:AsmA family protein [Usitatibacter sp.]
MTRKRALVTVVAVIILLPFAAALALVLIAQSEWGERWLEKQVASRIHREVQIEGIRIHAGWPPQLAFERLRIGNPEWAKTPNLIDATGLAAYVEIPPLLHRQLVIPLLQARSAEAGLEQKGDQATWQFGDGQKKSSGIDLRAVMLEDGHIVYRSEEEDTAVEVKVKGSLGDKGELKLEGAGKFKGEPIKVVASVPGLAPNATQPVHVIAKGTVGKTGADADGTFTTDLRALDLKFHLKGSTLKDLHKVTGIVLPDTPPYSVAGRLRREGESFVFDPFNGKIGDSDIGGSVTYAKGGKRPFFKADLHSKLLDFDDLGPLVGAPPKTGSGETASAEQQAKAQQLKASTHVLPRQPFSTEKWDEMDADVKLVAARVQRPKQLPIDTLSTHLVMKDGVLRLEPLNFGVAGGKLVSRVTIDSRSSPPLGEIRAQVENLKLAQLFPTLKSMEDAYGQMYGAIDLKGRGASIGDLLATSNGTMVMTASGGRVSDLLTQLLEIDVAKAAMLLGTRKAQVDLRCAVGMFNVKDGIVAPESFIVDTSETYIKVEGKVDLNQERLDLETRGRGKSASLLTLHTPIELQGPFKKPSVRPKAGPLAAQVAGAVALAAVNPALAVVPFVEPGKKQDADCEKLMAQARQKGAPDKQKVAAAAPR